MNFNERKSQNHDQKTNICCQEWHSFNVPSHNTSLSEVITRQERLFRIFPVQQLFPLWPFTVIKWDWIPEQRTESIKVEGRVTSAAFKRLASLYKENIYKVRLLRYGKIKAPSLGTRPCRRETGKTIKKEMKCLLPVDAKRENKSSQWTHGIASFASCSDLALVWPINSTLKSLRNWLIKQLPISDWKLWSQRTLEDKI